MLTANEMLQRFTGISVETPLGSIRCCCNLCGSEHLDVIGLNGEFLKLPPAVICLDCGNMRWAPCKCEHKLRTRFYIDGLSKKTYQYERCSACGHIERKIEIAFSNS